MEWRDQGMVLSARGHGEAGAILEVLTRDHGRHLGVVRGGASRKMTPLLQPGNQVELTWRARLADHLGAFQVEPLAQRAALVLSDPLRLAALSSLCASAAFCLPERDPLPGFTIQTEALSDAIVADHGWLTAYLDWEMALLQVTGFGLDLSTCAVTGSQEALAYVSPKSGRAVSRDAAGIWADRLLPLPSCLLGTPPDAAGALQALTLTGYFLNEKLAPSLGTRAFPAARARFVGMCRGLNAEAP